MCQSSCAIYIYHIQIHIEYTVYRIIQWAAAVAVVSGGAALQRGLSTAVTSLLHGQQLTAEQQEQLRQIVEGNWNDSIV